MKTGQQLIADIDACETAAGTCAFWWLGQMGFVVKLGRNVLYLDAYLSDNPRRQVRPLLHPGEVTHADVVFGSHDHGDHIDRASWPALAQASPGARFVVPRSVLPKLAADLDIDASRFIGLDDDERVEVGDLAVTGVASAHEFLERDPATVTHRFLGFIVEANGVTLYHAGDTCKYEGLETTLKRWKLDVVFLPINGRDAKRLAANCIGNMTYQEAADLAGAIRPRLTVPGHYEMFASNSEDPQRFVDYMRVKYPHLAVKLCEHGERVTLLPRDESV
ncbi:MAG TPA: MBL fold metallo-hydrolase [Planctomycetota bacterium]|nr:MBL fold metallo-hydrolase [Planctomycetota bacterium]